MQKYNKRGNSGLFDQDEISQKLSLIGNPLEKILDVIDFEMFRQTLESQLLNSSKKKQCRCETIRYNYDVQDTYSATLLWPWRHSDRISNT